ncbi:uncharacterized protein [Diadema antillarum]|uniref:uncharacterized protein n=1 Tax=Diadema antillarum TaxID=105358 RepID=UPI003A89D82C
METKTQLDETSCGPFCQHPYCWYSNRRVERGLPMTKEKVDKAESTVLAQDDELPTLKILNVLEDYGYDPNDQYQSYQPVPSLKLSPPKDDPQHGGRSLSAPVDRKVSGNISGKEMPLTEVQQSLVSPGRTLRKPSTQLSRNNRSAPAHASPFSQYGSRVNKVDTRDLLRPERIKKQGVVFNSKIYVWCPSSQNGDTSATTKSQHASMGEDAVQTKVHPKDVTAEMLPETMATTPGKSRRTPPNNQTPTGGRPYTHPARSPPPLTRRTLPQDYDEGIAQLLQLPRDVLLELLEQTRESDLFDKNKVALLLEKLMPLIHFDKNDLTQPHLPLPSPGMMLPPPHPAAPPATVPLHSSGILRQKKVTLLDSSQRRLDAREVLRTPPPTRSLPFFLDETACSGITNSEYTKRERPDPDTREDDGETTMISPTVASEELTKRRPLGPIRAGPPLTSTFSRRKVTSVSAKSLPPLQPGVRPIRPFNYSGQSVDLALSPLSTPELDISEKTSTPYDGRASTVYVTVPTDLSDHTPPASPVSFEQSPVPPITRQSSARMTSASSAPSDEFPELHWVDFENAIHSSTTPHTSTQILRVPYGAPTLPNQESIEREAVITGGLSVSQEQTPAKFEPQARPTATPSGANVPLEEKANLKEQERLITTATTDTREAVPMVTPVQRPESASPYDAATSVLAQASEKAVGSPAPAMTPLPPTVTPEVWPVVDERDYMASPDRKMDRLSNKKVELILAPVAPPPSPEPAGLDMDYDIQEVASKSTAASSLTPLAEEEEEEGDLVREETMSSAAPGVNRTGTRSRGYLADDEGESNNATPPESRETGEKAPPVGPAAAADPGVTKDHVPQNVQENHEEDTEGKVPVETSNQSQSMVEENEPCQK